MCFELILTLFLIATPYVHVYVYVYVFVIPCIKLEDVS